ncbi:HSP20-like chaperone [Tuber borchii]|uniref:HSP20-like chaperone n=1 Tax=Tuber borchii TaxID=42251 RepID=A0A2T6ZPM1_TUBBO|nr:HSP20-like chaperone [Tuber borchii]
MTQKCAHKGCGKKFTDPEEECHYHPGAPIFHEGQKGWQCCKTRVLTFDEFLTIPPCSVGKHSVDAPVLAPVQTSGPASQKQKHPEVAPPPEIGSDGIEVYGQQQSLQQKKALPKVTAAPGTPPPEKKEKPLEQDDPSMAVPPEAKCKRLGCEATYDGGNREDEDEKCVFHPGAPIFHEGSKGYSCCKRRVLEFDQFMKIPGCATGRHLFVGAPKSGDEEELVSCRNDFYQTYTDVIVSIFAKKVDKTRAEVHFSERQLDVDLPMPDDKRYKVSFPLYGAIDPAGCEYKVLTTKIELKLKKADGLSWPTLRSDEVSGEIIQIGKPATA